MKLRFKYTLPVLAAALSVNAARAQFNVKGNVALDNGDKAIGATLRLLRSGEVATTDADGNFTLHSSHATDRLVAAYIGFRSDTIDVTAANANALAIVLREEVQRVLGELVSNMSKYTAPQGRARLVIESDGRSLEAMASNDVGIPGQAGGVWAGAGAPGSGVPGYDAFSSGLGLEGARRRVEALGGSLSVSQGEGRWTTVFSVPFQAVS